MKKQVIEESNLFRRQKNALKQNCGILLIKLLDRNEYEKNECNYLQLY